VPGECALRLRNDAHGVWAGLADPRRPEAGGGVVQGLPQWPELLAAGSVKGPERRGPSSHGKLGGGGGGKVGRVALGYYLLQYKINTWNHPGRVHAVSQEPRPMAIMIMLQIGR
jgi:hypothetical protein